MPSKCKCGGRYVPQLGYVEDCATKKRYKRFKCNKCGRETIQGLRMAKV